MRILRIRRLAFLIECRQEVTRSVAAPVRVGAGVRFDLLGGPCRRRYPRVPYWRLGRRLYAAFEEAARRQGTKRLKAITSVGNAGSIAFHSSLGFRAQVVEDYNGPGHPMVVFGRPLPARGGAMW
ncbi:hypothetical protein GCM10010383_55560 [Streptomyces lomondensis]|uniref:N-acetyltransferase domain-containing protein n=1 Tax=Streptomyces lomondensis TaxID=68229 RepID=A0ABQ2XHW0_9ACTN|nr:hypothetical protein GCM10010383_55560 [Streptomyces lomondensis]